jgi:OOP family OmpA-OmpF porin
MLLNKRRKTDVEMGGLITYNFPVQEDKMKVMKTLIVAISLATTVLFLAGVCLAQEEDAENCKDYPMLSRMKNFYITNCESNFDAVEFYLNDDQTKTVEGQKTAIDYGLKEDAPRPSDLQILRNYSNAVKSLGGSIVYQSPTYISMKIVKDGKEAWVSVETYNGATGYKLIVLESGEMVQEVTANEMLEALNKDGFMALYINFDTGKSDIKPESQPIIAQIADLLKNNPSLKLSIEGHTDNVGNPQSNKTLSEQRAKAVVAAVVSQGIDASRLSAVGWGQERPVADNRSEEGRAKNRRVEIVKK